MAPGFTTSRTFLAVLIATLHLCGQSQACKCGRSSASRMYGGYDVENGEYPWMGRLLTVKDFTITQCGATMISTRYGLTAGHCVPKYDNPDSFMSFGTSGLYTSYNHDRRYPVEKFFTKYTGDRGTDIAVVKLTKDINVPPICLPPNDNSFAGEKGVMLGYGKTESGDVSDQLLAGDVTIPSNRQCDKVQYVSSNEICAGNYGGGAAFCNGDSGGPLMVHDAVSDCWIIAGIISASYECDDTDSYGVLTRVSKFVDWIQEVTTNAGCTNNT